MKKNTLDAFIFDEMGKLKKDYSHLEELYNQLLKDYDKLQEKVEKAKKIINDNSYDDGDFEGMVYQNDILNALD